MLKLLLKIAVLGTIAFVGFWWWTSAMDEDAGAAPVGDGGEATKPESEGQR